VIFSKVSSGADRKDREEVKPRLSSSADPFEPLRDACSAAARNLGLAAAPHEFAPEHWQRVLAAVEVRARLRGIDLPEGWRQELAEQMGRSEPDAFAGPES
jgi:hypothetical protein